MLVASHYPSARHYPRHHDAEHADEDAEAEHDLAHPKMLFRRLQHLDVPQIRSMRAPPRPGMTAWQRPTSKTEARGYGARWRKIAAIVLRRDGYLCGCPRCLYGKLRITPADAVDHIRPRALYIKEALAAGLREYDGILASDVWTNLRAINSQCHKRVTMEQRGYKPRPSISVTGWPIDD